MTVHIPKWLLVVALVGAALVVAFLLGRSSDNDSTDSAGGEEAKAEARPCNEAEATDAVMNSEFPDLVRANPFGIPLTGPFLDDIGGYHIAITKCADLTGDGVNEMVVAIGAGAAGRIFNWAIYSPTEEAWELQFHREGVQVADLSVRDNVVVEKQPTIGPDDAFCCPSGYRNAEISASGGEFAIRSGIPSDDREITVNAIDGVTKIGPLDPETASPIDAANELGAPSIASRSGDSCPSEWRDLGLVIFFANFGGEDACGLEGRIGSFILAGSAAEQAGWQAEGISIGTPRAEVREKFPDAEAAAEPLPPPFRGSPVAQTLIEKPVPFGESGTVPAMSAIIEDAKVAYLRFYAGAAGE
jgi:hypothetical protein